MTQTTISTAAAGARDLGLVGRRQLHAVQLIDIGRLTSHVIPFVPGTFVAISGRGPKGDSNESGKTTFLAATSLLLGDAEWRLRGGGQHAATLLFNPRAVGAAEHLADAADHGYIIGLFATAGEPLGDPLSVWLRINRSSPYLEAKAHYGESFVDPASQRPVQLAADDQWAQLTQVTGRSLGASTFVEALYGNAPRCVAHLTKRGDLPAGVSLLNTNAGAFTREQIGAALVSLAGRQDILDDDRSLRSDLNETEREFVRLRDEATERERGYVEQLGKLDGRDRARQLLETATRDWATHDARRYLDAIEARQIKLDEHEQALVGEEKLEAVLRDAAARLAEVEDDHALRDEHAKAADALAEADERVDAAGDRESTLRASLEGTRERFRDLRAAAANWAGPTPGEAEAAEHTAHELLRAAEAELAVAAAEAAKANDLLVKAREGRSDGAETLERLHACGIDAAGLLDSITIQPSHRALFEPLLWPYRDATVVAEKDLAAATAALAELPWAVIVSGPADVPTPEGVAACPVGARKLLGELARRSTVAADPVRASDLRLGITVIAGQTALAGREARVRTCEARAETAEAALAEATRRRDEAALVAEARTDDHRRASAAQAAELARKQQLTLEDELNAARAARTTLKADRDQLKSRERQLALKLDAIEIGRAQARTDHTRAAEATATHHEGVENLAVELRALDEAVRAAELVWAKGEELARQRCAEDGRDEGTLRNQANVILHEALAAIGMRRDDDWAPSDELLEAWRRRLQDENLAPFPILAAPLAEHFDALSDQDIVLRERIEAERQQTTEALEAAEIEVTQSRVALTRLQDAIQTSIESAITAIEQQFDRLDREQGGFGAKLELEMRPPLDATDTWHWSVTPMWQRSPDGRMVPYTAPTNSAQDKLYTVNLVLAALLAVPNPEGRVLILDELGDSLGYEHRREMLAAIAATAHAKQITVLGTCQDDVLHHAADFTQEIVFFEYSDTRDLLNRPARLFGYDPDGARVELTREAVLHGRPPV